MPRVSVITPCFNNEKEIGVTLESLIKQSFRDWECVVIDDGSTDDSAAVVNDSSRKDPRIRLLRQANSGPSVARNNGIDAARGEFTLFLDGDDWIGPRMLECCTRMLDGNVEASAAYANQTMFFDGTDHQLPMAGPPHSGRLFPELARGNRLGPGSVLWRSSLFEHVGRFDPAIPGCEDWDFFVQLARLGTEFVHVPVDGFHYRKRRGGLSSRGKSMWEAGIKVLERSFSSDSRVSKPDPQFVAGLPRAQYPNARLNYALVCASLAVAEGDSEAACNLADLEILPRLEPNPWKLARMLERTIWNAAVLPKDSWERFWIHSGTSLLDYLAHLECGLASPGFAGQTLDHLTGRLARDRIMSSRSWRLVQWLQKLRLGSGGGR
jgi:hypothetical protein